MKKVIVFGAGGYLRKHMSIIQRFAEIAYICDNDKKKQKEYRYGKPIIAPDEINQKQFDYIVIANITESVAMMMKDFLLASGVAEEKIRWFSAEFLGRA